MRRTGGGANVPISTAGTIGKECFEKWREVGGEQKIGTGQLGVPKRRTVRSLVSISIGNFIVIYLSVKLIRFTMSVFCKTNTLASRNGIMARMNTKSIAAAFLPGNSRHIRPHRAIVRRAVTEGRRW